MQFISFKNYTDYGVCKHTLEINQELSISCGNTISYFIKMRDGLAYHNLNGPAYVIAYVTLEYYIYGEHLGTNLSNAEFEKLKNQYFKKLTFQ